MEMMSKKQNCELPDAVLFHIFSKLSLRDLAKTSILSKQWLHEWRLRMDFNFDVQTIFDYNTIQELEERPTFSKGIKSEFSRRLDQFALRYQGTKISSLRVDFPLGVEHSSVIGRLIINAVAKGVNRIELLLKPKTSDYFPSKMLCEFPCTLLADVDSSLKYLHLEYCLLLAPFDLSGFKNLRTLVLNLVVAESDELLGLLFSNSVQLVDLTLTDCYFNSDLNITSSTLRRLNIVQHRGDIDMSPPLMSRGRRMHISAPNLSSFQYSNDRYRVHKINIEADKLSRLIYTGGMMSKSIRNFSALKNVTTIMLTGLYRKLDLVIPSLFSNCLRLENVVFKNCRSIPAMKIISPNLRRLGIIDCLLLPKKIYIEAMNLSHFEYVGQMKQLSINAPRLSLISWHATKGEKIPFPSNLIRRLHRLRSLVMIMNNLQIVPLPAKELRPLRNLRNLVFFVEGTYDPITHYFWILDIVKACLHLQELSLTIRNLHLESSRRWALQRERREHAGFFHNELRYVELHGCVGTINVIELASEFLRNANSLEKITFSSSNRLYTGVGNWTKDSHRCSWYDRNLIREMLKDEVTEQCQLIFL